MRRSPAPVTPTARRLLLLPVAMACALGLLLPMTASVSAEPDPADRKRSVDSQISGLRDQLSETNADVVQAYASLQATQAKLPAATTALNQAQASARAAANANAAAAQDLSVAQANEAKIVAELETIASEIAEQRRQVGQFASQIYQEQGFGQLDMALSSTSPQQFADRIAMLETVMDIQSQSMSELATARADRTAQEDRLSAVRAESETAKRNAEAALVAASAAEQQAAAAKQQLDSLAAQQAALQTDLKAKAEIERKRLDGYEAESARLDAVIKKRADAALRQTAGAASRAPKRSSRSFSRGSGSGVLQAPLPARVSSEYGMRFHPIYKINRLHNGRDYAAPCGTPITAARAGTVVEAGYNGPYGNRVVIDHGMVNGVYLTTAYNHMQSLAVGTGPIRQGQVVGYEGTTGVSTGCHLHFQVYANGEFADPRQFL